MLIDIYAHLIPRKYWDEVMRRVESSVLEQYVSREALGVELTRTLWNMEERFRIMDKYPDMVEVITPSGPPLELIANLDIAFDLARIYNDEMAALLDKYPDRFIGAVAYVPMNNIDAALKETERAIEDLGFRGILIHTPIYDNNPDKTKPIDMPELMPIYEKMSDYDLPIWLHPKREYSMPDYTTENYSKYLIHHTFGWPYETTVAMARLVFSGIFDRFPNLKVITHHAGAMVPFLGERIVNQCEWYKVGLKAKFLDKLARPPVEYFRKFYADTAVYANTSALACARAFFGSDHLLFGTDMPYDSLLGEKSISEVIGGIEGMEIDAIAKQMIFEGNARTLLRLS